MLRAFLCSRSAVLVFPWFEPDPEGDEQGVRVELRLLRPTATRGSRSAAQELTVDQPVWRADLFELINGASATLDRAHFHPRFDGVEPCERCWDEQLGSDPFGWLANQLADVRGLVAVSGTDADQDDGLDWLSGDADQIAGAVPAIVEAAKAALADARAGHRYP